MKFTPRPWQVPMIEYLLEHKRCNLWADMGSGKTSAVLSALEQADMFGQNPFPALVIAPKRVARKVWPDEMGWDHLRGFKISTIIGDASARVRALNTKADIYTINYDNIPWLVEQCGKRWPFRQIVADESTRLKGFRLRVGTKRAASLAQIVRSTSGWWNLTGTPAPNGLKDLWGQTWFVDQGERLGKTWTGFKERWFDSDMYTHEVVPKDFAADQIHRRLQDCTLSIQMKDWVDIKEPIVRPIYVDLPPKAMAQYKELEEEMFVALSQEIELTAFNAAARTTKCLQFAAGAVYYEQNKWTPVHDEKLDALESIIEETNGANLFVAYWWKHDLQRILKRFPQARQLQTQKDEDDWNAGKISLLLAHPQSAGHGLNLQRGGHHIVYFSDWWNLETRQQILERIGPVRQLQAGFDRPVFVYQIIARGTTDEDVAIRHATKAETQQILMNAMKRRKAA